MILAGFSLFIIFLLVIGMPVAFTLSVAGILGIIQFVDVSFLSQVPVIAYKTLDSYVLTSVPLYILMSQIMLPRPCCITYCIKYARICIYFFEKLYAFLPLFHLKSGLSYHKNSIFGIFWS